MKISIFKSVRFVKFVLLVLLFVCTFILSGFVSVNTASGEITFDLIGDLFVHLDVNDMYIEHGVVVIDSGTDVSSLVSTSGHIDTSTPGRYVISYTYNDITVERIVYVDTAKSCIVLNGDITQVLNSGDKYIEAGFWAYDELNQDITDTVVVSGQVNTDVPGQYIIKYSATTEQGTNLSVQRNVEVISAPTSTLSTDYTDFFEGAVFLGDSITLSFKSFVQNQRKNDVAFFGEARFLAENSYSVRVAANYKDGYYLHPKYDGRRSRPQYSLKAMDAKKVIIMLGVNDVSTNQDVLLENYYKLLGKVKAENPEIDIYIVSIFPMTQARESKTRNNERINYLNSELRKYSQVNHIPFMDINEIFMTDGQIDKAFYRDNYVHINEQGFEIYSETLLSAIHFFNTIQQSNVGEIVDVEEYANIRSTPSIELNPVSTIAKGESVQISPYYYNPNWYQVTYNGQQGYIYKPLILLN